MADNFNFWSLVQSGHFNEACTKADLEFEQTKNIFPLRNKVYALMHLKKYTEVIALCTELIERENGEAETDFKFLGIANWVLDKKEEAIKNWQSAEKCKYTDAAGGVELQLILYFAALKTGNKELLKQSLKKLKKLVKSKAAAVNWPGALAPFLLDESPSEVLLSKIVSIPVLKERQSCQAYFAIAVKELEKDNIDNYKQNLEIAISYGSAAYLEQLYYLAQIELQNLNNIPK